MSALAAQAWGPAGGPAVLCLHGVRGVGSRFGFLADRLPGARVVAVDLRGHGDSTWLPPWDLATHAADVRAFVRDEELSPALWVGHSFGARVLLELACRDEPALERVVLLDPAFAIDPAQALAQARADAAPPVVASVEEAVQARIDAGAAHADSRGRVAADLRRQLDADPGGGLRLRFEPAAVVTAWSEMAAPLPALSCLPPQTTVVLAEQSITPAAVQRELAERFAVHRVPGGHNLHWDAPDATAALVGEALHRVGVGDVAG